jgi:acyl-CoA synthetase (NDP forming)
MIEFRGKRTADTETIDAIFYPRTVAVIGASSDNAKERSQGWMGRLLRCGFQGKIIPVNPTAKEILNLKAYPSITAIPDPVDYAIISVPAPLVAKVIEDCVKKGV